MIPLWGLWAIVTGIAGFGCLCFWAGDSIPVVRGIRLRIRRYRVQQIMHEQVHEQFGGLL